MADSEPERAIRLEGEIRADDIDVFRAASETHQLLAIAELRSREQRANYALTGLAGDPSLLVAVLVVIVAAGFTASLSDVDFSVIAGFVVALMGFTVLYGITSRWRHEAHIRLGRIAARLAVYERIYRPDA